MPPRARPLVAVAASLLLAGPAAAQIVRLPQQSNPAYWLSVDAGVLRLDDVDDGRTASEWNFDTGVQYRATVERDLGNNTMFGVAGTYARLPVAYTRVAGSAEPGPVGSFDADGTIASLSAVLRGGGGQGLHQVVELSAGARYYGRFRGRDGVELAPGRDWDPTASLGYGFGYLLGDRAAIEVVQDAQFTYHQRERTEGVGYNGGFHSAYVTRLGLRYGLGTRGFGTRGGRRR